MFSFGRSNRKQFWIMIVVVALVAGAVSAVIPATNVSIPLTIVWILICGRRLHDFGRTAWWTLIPAGLAIALGVYATWQLLQPLNTSGIDDLEKVMARRGAVADALIGAALVVQLGYSLWVGLVKGDPVENRFGPSPDAHPAKAVRS
jgi:uncharacterized membrane protein YhaH (DUF805 family)